MPGQHSLHDVIITWFPINENPGGSEYLDTPVCTERLAQRRVWTTTRDLIGASNDQEIWRQPTVDEWSVWDLNAKREGQIETEVAWLVATTGEPGLGVPTRMAVRLQETLVG